MAPNLTSRSIPSLKLAWIVRPVWLAGILGSVWIRIVSWPYLFQVYQNSCPIQLCYPLSRLNVESVQFILHQGITIDQYITSVLGLEWIFCLAWWGLSLLLAWRRPLDPLACVIILYGMTIPVSAPVEALRPVSESYGPMISFVVFLNAALLLPFLSIFPDGHWVPKWSKYPAILLVILYFFSAWVILPSPYHSTFTQLTSLLNVFALSFGLGLQIFRFFWRSNEIHKKQVQWMLLGLSFIVVNYLVGSILLLTGKVGVALIPMVAFYILGETLIPLALGMAVFRYRLFTIDLIVNRTMVYLGLSAGVVGIYALITALASYFLPKQGGFWGSLIGAAIVAIVFQPLRYALQRGVNHLLYGELNEPYTAITHLGNRLGDSLAPETMLPMIANAVSNSLKLPYVAIELRQPGGTYQKRTEVGLKEGVAIYFPLRYQGEQIGRLVVTARPGERGLREPDKRLLSDLAQQAGIAIHAAKLTDDLQQIREQLVMAREEERQRIRRDLHDGLGPSLATILMLADASRGKIRTNPDRADTLMVELTEQAQTAIKDMRGLIQALRPPILDDLGFIPAVQALADTLTQSGLTVNVKVEEDFQVLPAAVEVAAMRIIQEALTNVARHSGAKTAVVSISQSSTLDIRVEDDGTGMQADILADGIGLISMRTRAEELGGSLTITTRRPGGTIVEARLPLRRSDAANPVVDR